jgi:outer membrane protein assembly factor BamE (lipoprotein component of BamABCDE complex)
MLGVLALLPGCGSPPEERQDARQAEVTVAQWDWLQQTKQRLDEQRERLAQLEARSEAGKPPAEELLRLRKEVDDLGEDFNRRLVEYVNANASAVSGGVSGGDSGGDTPGERQLAAIRMKSDEDILLAREYIEEAGDYRRAIEIYETALAADPDNPRLRTELETARARRYVTRERFALVREGMAQDEVRRLLGPPNLQDVREYPERGVTAWFYPKDASGAAAAVWFRKGDSTSEAYQLDFDAIEPPAAASPGRPAARPQAAPSPVSPPACTPTPRP